MAKANGKGRSEGIRVKAQSVNGTFVALHHAVIDSPAWRAMSHGARSLFIALRRRVSNDCSNNGGVFMSTREASEEIGSDKDQVARWFKEIEHFGFAVMTEGGCLGPDGKGKAPHWRLTDCGVYRGKIGGSEPPTREFLKWDGTRFKAFKPTPPKRQTKQNPVRENPDTSGGKTRTPTGGKTRTPTAESGRENPDIQAPSRGGKTRTYSRKPSPQQKRGTPDPYREQAESFLAGVAIDVQAGNGQRDWPQAEDDLRALLDTLDSDDPLHQEAKALEGDVICWAACQR